MEINGLSFAGHSGLIKRTVKFASGFEKKIIGVVEINLVSSDEIKRLNRIYRGQNKVTDVLSFAWNEEAIIKTKILGQLYISPLKIKSQAKEFDVPENEEFVRMLAHGLLHLVGYEHAKNKQAKRMFDLQEKIVRNVLNK